MVKFTLAARPRGAQASGEQISGRMRGFLEPARASTDNLKSSCRREYARGVVVRHLSQVAVGVGEASPIHAGSLRTRESATSYLANEGHGAVAEAAQGFKGDGSKRVARTVVVPEVFLQLSLSRLREALQFPPVNSVLVNTAFSLIQFFCMGTNHAKALNSSSIIQRLQ
jgi:hypothetical protein